MKNKEKVYTGAEWYPDFIRIRTLAITDFSDLASDVLEGVFTPLDDEDTAKELLLMLDHLYGISSTVRSDHILNLFQEVDGVLPGDKNKMTLPIRNFLDMGPEDRLMFRVGRRAGVLSSLDDMKNPSLMDRVLKIKAHYGVTLDNVDEFTSTIIKRFI